MHHGATAGGAGRPFFMAAGGMTKRREAAAKKAAWSEETGARVVAALRGGMTTEALARQDWGPSRWALARWMKVRPAFGAAVTAARAAAWDERRGEIEGEWRDARAAAVAGPLRHLGTTGRPRLYGVDVEAQVLMRIAEGETLSAICRDEGMPSITAVHHWRWSRPGFSAAFNQARLAQAEAMADAVVDIADGCEPAMMALQKARLRMEARRWTVAARRAQGAAPLSAAAMTPEQREARIKELLAKARAAEGRVSG